MSLTIPDIPLGALNTAPVPTPPVHCLGCIAGTLSLHSFLILSLQGEELTGSLRLSLDPGSVPAALCLGIYSTYLGGSGSPSKYLLDFW